MDGIVSKALMNHAMISLAVFIGGTALALILRKILLGVLQKWAKKTQTAADDLLLAAVRIPSIYWCIAIGLYLTLGTSELPAPYVAYSFKAIHVLVILSVTLVVANVSANLLNYAIQRSQIPIPITGLSRTLIQVVVLTIGVLILLDTLGISITPVITALGVGGLAVALALQDTLSNFFAGLHILVERSIRVGDFVRLESGQEGHVADISWRTTRILMRPNTMVIIPNNKLAQSVVTNYSLPERRTALQIPISVGYGSDPDQVENVLVEEAIQGAQEIPGLLAHPVPLVRLIPGLGESSLNFTLICQIKGYDDQPLVQHELTKRILKRFRKEGIEIPFPIRTVYLKSEKPED